MVNILLYVSNGLIIIGYIYYLLMILFGKSKKVSSSDGFDVTKDIISEYNTINIIESKGYFTVYNIKYIKTKGFIYERLKTALDFSFSRFIRRDMFSN